ncbi:MAG: hypothetical protein FK734_04210 [Asgard group archaeon]|nr:hypothetical protein [Asgard group archaeon]
MIEPINKIITIVAERVTLDTFAEWLKTILKYTGMSIGSIFLFIFVFWLVMNLLIVILVEIIPFLKGIVAILEFIMLPGSLMHMVWHVYALKKLNYPTEQVINFGWGWSRVGIRVLRPLKTLREGIIFFWAPLMNIPVIIGWIIPGAILFQWLDTLIDNTVFYWIWLYVLVSLITFGLPDLADLVNPLQISIVKTPEFYLFVVFYVVIAPITLVLWGWGITVIFSLLYTITSIYAIEKISKEETKRLALRFDKVFYKTETPVNFTAQPPPVYIIPNESDEENEM